MEKKHLAVGLAPVLCTWGVAQATFTYDNAIQGSSGFASASGGGFSSDGYGLNPPDSLNSWSTGEVLISVMSPNETNARVRSSYASTLQPERLAFVGNIFDAAASVPVSGTAEFSYQQTFSVAFHLDVPAEVLLSASLSRQTLSGDPPFTPMFLEFGRKDGSPIISWAYEGDEANFQRTFAQTQFLLQPGNYTLQVFSNNFFKGTSSVSYTEQMRFDLQVVPAPAATALLPLAVLGMGRRRR